MKKLMITAAVATMIGGAFATGYDFTATLKTTVGKGGKDATITYNFGKNDRGEFWYKDGGWGDVNNNYIRQASSLSNNVETVTKFGEPVLGFIKNDKGYVTLNDADDLGYIQDLAGEYNVKSAGQWCDTIKVLIPKQCYRVAGTKKIKTVVYGNCCDCVSGFYSINPDRIDDSYAVTNSATAIVWEGVGLQVAATNWCANVTYTNTLADAALFQWFGAQASDKANKIEIFAPVNSYTTDGISFVGFLAGQGSMSRNSMSLSGNIVGILEAPTCENCCTDPSKAVAWSCWEESTLLYTAAFGSFRIKYNNNY